MPYYTFYCNEVMLLDHWKNYHEPNKMLRRLLLRTDKQPVECAEEYYEKMNNQESVSYDRQYLIETFTRFRKYNEPLRSLDQVVLYKRDIDFIKNAKKNFHITNKQVQLLLGIVFMSRCLQKPTVDLQTNKQIKNFNQCLSRKDGIEYIGNGSWSDGYYAPIQLSELCDQYGIIKRVAECDIDKIGCVYEYPEYYVTNNDEVGYVYKINDNTNHPMFDKLSKQIFSMHDQYCIVCGKPYVNGFGNRSLYCPECAKEVKKERDRARQSEIRRRVRIERELSKNNIDRR